VRLRALGAEVRVCAPPDKEFAVLLARVGVPLVPIGQPVFPPVTGATPPSAADLSPRRAELVAAQFHTVAAAAEQCDAPVATGVMPTGVWR
jgi:vancomycin aglycone glucosyltransferase